jgi:hypothetical protein
MKRGPTILAAVIAALSLSLSGCGAGTGACASSSGIGEECFQGWTQQECTDQNSKQVNGLKWTWSSSTCESQGFTVSCGNNTFRRPGKSC